jgi:hypothetical protein
MIQMWFVLDGLAAVSVLIAAFFAILAMMIYRTHNSVRDDLGQCEVAMRELANPELSKLNLGNKIFADEKRQFGRYEWDRVQLVYGPDAAMRLVPCRQWGALVKTQLANHRDYLAPDYYARQTYLAHYSPRMRRLILNQGAA